MAGSSIWYPYFYPYFTDRLVTFNMEIKLPVGWQSVSQGARTEHRAGIDGQLDGWVIDKPQEEIYLIAAKFTEYSQFAGNVSAMVFCVIQIMNLRKNIWMRPLNIWKCIVNF